MDSSRIDDVEGVRQALMRLMAIADRLEARNTQTVLRIEAATAALDQGVIRLEAGGERFAQSALQVIGTGAQQSITAGVGQAMGEFRQHLRHSANTAQAVTQAMGEQCERLTAARRTLVWNGLIALLMGSLLSVGAAAWVVHRSVQEVAQAHFGQDILRATQRGAINRCGDSLCARIGSKPKRFGRDSQYVLLED